MCVWLGNIIACWDQLDNGDIIYWNSKWYLVNWLTSDYVRLTEL